jgi:orotate phosphoribosyltransferase
MDINELIKRAQELRAKGLRTGEIADELNVSRETATWLLTRHKPKEAPPVPKDIFIDWSTVGMSSQRMRYFASALTDIILENVGVENVEVVVGIALNGVPLASLVADDLEAYFAIYRPKKSRWEPEAAEVKGAFSTMYSNVEGKKCVVIDDVITTGGTITETIEMLREIGANPIAVAVMIDKKGLDKVKDVPIYSLIKVGRVE